MNGNDGKSTAQTSTLPKAGDLVLRDEEGRYYLLKKAIYEAEQIRPDSPGFEKVTAQVKRLTQQGIMLADVPKGGLGGVGAMCKLINLTGIRMGPSQPQPQPQPQPQLPCPFVIEDT